MLSVRECVSQAARTQLASQLSATAQLAESTVDSIEQLSELNLGLARVTFEQSNLVARQLAAAENARQFFLLAAAQATPATTRVFDYGYYLASIASSTQEEFIRTVGTRIEDTNRAFIELLADLGRAAPSGFRMTAALVDSVAHPGECGTASANAVNAGNKVPAANRKTGTARRQSG